MKENQEPYKKLIITLSIVIPIAVAALFGIKIPGYDLSFLPPIYASINGITAILLMISYDSIKNGERARHELINKICIVLSASFLIMYVLYHMTSEETKFGGEGIIRYVYYFILITHIALSVIVIPLVLFTFSRALGKNFERHKRLARFAFPLWFYVAVSGVIVYILISPYYK